MAAGPAPPACVSSPDGVVLYRPGGAPCGNDERAQRVRVRARQQGARTDFAESSAIPPADPFVPVATSSGKGSGNGAWLPAEPGTRSLFRSSLKRTLYAGPHLAKKFQYQGDRSEELLPAPKGYGAARSELRVTDRLMGARGVADISETQRHFLVPSPSRYRVVASEMAVRGKRVVVKQPPDATPILKGAKPGVRWPAGVEVIDGLAFEREGELMGVQALDTPAGRFERCLVVRYTGSLMKPGLSPLGDGVRVKSGSVETTEWIAQGVGRVQVRQEGELLLGEVDGMPGRLTFEGLAQLHQFQRPASARTAAHPAARDAAARAAKHGSAWMKGTFALALDPALPLGAELPEDAVRFRADGAVELLARGRRQALCQPKIRHDLLRLSCRDLASAQQRSIDLVVSPDRHTLTTAMGSQYARVKPGK